MGTIGEPAKAIRFRQHAAQVFGEGTVGVALKLELMKIHLLDAVYLSRRSYETNNRRVISLFLAYLPFSVVIEGGVGFVMMRLQHVN